MPVRLNQPLLKDERQNPDEQLNDDEKLNDDECEMLDILQGNILKGHGRKHTAHVFLRFDNKRPGKAREFLKTYAEFLTSAHEQAENAASVREAREKGLEDPDTPAFIACVLSNHGYAALGFDEHERPDDPAFRAGMKARREVLSDPGADKWDPTYKGEIHAMVLIGGNADKDNDEKSTQVDNAINVLLGLLEKTGDAVVLVSEKEKIDRGRVYRNANDEGLEHFGYVDGRSQPLLRQQDIEREAEERGGIDNWDPAFPLRQFLVRDPAVPNRNAFGSYFVFRKLEQNVAKFKDAEEKLGESLKQLAAIKDPKRNLDSEIAGAMIIGRFEDGTPVVESDEEKGVHPVPNNFNYDGDPKGLKCPYSAHTRKVNPRGETQQFSGVPQEEERSHMMARRGITYGKRDQNEKKEFTGELKGPVGLLFMSFQSDIAAQFEYTQAALANNENAPRHGTGIDPVIGQGGALPQTYRAGWGDDKAPTVCVHLSDFVTLKGGEYFFAPSKEFFQTIKTDISA